MTEVNFRNVEQNFRREAKVSSSSRRDALGPPVPEGLRRSAGTSPPRCTLSQGPARQFLRFSRWWGFFVVFGVTFSNNFFYRANTRFEFRSTQQLFYVFRSFSYTKKGVWKSLKDLQKKEVSTSFTPKNIDWKETQRLASCLFIFLIRITILWQDWKN